MLTQQKAELGGGDLTHPPGKPGLGARLRRRVAGVRKVPGSSRRCRLVAGSLLPGEMTGRGVSDGDAWPQQELNNSITKLGAARVEAAFTVL